MMDKSRLKRLQDRRKKFENVVESLIHLEKLTDIDRVIIRDITHETCGYILPVGDLIKNYKQELGEINRLIENLRNKG
jgi:hypothetical protein